MAFTIIITALISIESGGFIKAHNTKEDAVGILTQADIERQEIDDIFAQLLVRDDWISKGIETPSVDCVSRSKYLAKELIVEHDLSSKYIEPSIEEGIYLFYRLGSISLSFELYNDEDSIVAIINDLANKSQIFLEEVSMDQISTVVADFKQHAERISQ